MAQHPDRKERIAFTIERVSPIIGSQKILGELLRIRLDHMTKWRTIWFMPKVLLPVFLTAVVLLFALPVPAESGLAVAPVPALHLPFGPGEKLTYYISWSNFMQAGTAVLEVREDRGVDGSERYRIISTANSAGIVAKFYKVSDIVESVVDGNHHVRTLAFRLDQTHGKRSKKRDMAFDRAKGTVQVSADGRQERFAVPDDVQDALSSLYYVRTRQDFVVGKPIVVNVHDDGKTWAVEVITLGREKLKTVLGEIDTIKIKTYPRYEGVFRNKGEIFIWLTDDARKIPVLMKSTITIGTIVSTLVEVRTGEKGTDGSSRFKSSFQDR